MSYYDTDYFTSLEPINNINGALIWTIASVILAVIGGVVLYFTVFNDKSAEKYKGILAKVYDIVKFKYFIVYDLFKILYLIGALFITLISFTYIGKWQFFIVLIGGNIILRISYELLMLFIELCKNVGELNTKRKK